jgi:glycosyltransferase involved in cell wall biosynthesis
MMGERRISFAIPYYSNPGYLAEAIDSVRRQTIDEWELVVVDDHGPEPAKDLVAAMDDARLSYLRNDERRGLPGNWNECVARTTAPLVTLLHGDDRLLPTYAERLLAVADEQPHAAAYFTGVKLIDGEGRPTRTYVDFLKRLVSGGSHSGEVVGDKGLAALLAANFIYCPTLSLRRDAVGDAPFDESWHFVCDWDFTARLLLEGRSLVGLDESLLEYRRHPSQTTARLTVDAQRFSEELGFLKQMQARTAARGYSAAARAAHRRVGTRGHVAVSASLDLAKGRVRQAWTKAKVLARDLRS